MNHAFKIKQDSAARTVTLDVNDFSLTLAVPVGKDAGPEWEKTATAEGFCDMLFSLAMLMKAKGRVNHFEAIAEKVGKVLDIYDRCVLKPEAERAFGVQPEVPV